jgi:hypothetical protein
MVRLRIVPALVPSQAGVLTTTLLMVLLRPSKMPVKVPDVILLPIGTVLLKLLPTA